MGLHIGASSERFSHRRRHRWSKSVLRWHLHATRENRSTGLAVALAFGVSAPKAFLFHGHSGERIEESLGHN